MASDEATPVKRSRWPSLASALTSFEDRSMLGAVSLSVVGRWWAAEGRRGRRGGAAPALRHPDVRATPFALTRHPPQLVFALVRGGLQPSPSTPLRGRLCTRPTRGTGHVGLFRLRDPPPRLRRTAGPTCWSTTGINSNPHYGKYRASPATGS